MQLAAIVSAGICPRCSNEQSEAVVMDIQVGGIIGLLILIADVYAIVKVVQSGATTGVKVLWIVVILLFPVLGLIIWWFAGPKG
jgi:hypothetical protein